MQRQGGSTGSPERRPRYLGSWLFLGIVAVVMLLILGPFVFTIFAIALGVMVVRQRSKHVGAGPGGDSLAESLMTGLLGQSAEDWYAFRDGTLLPERYDILRPPLRMLVGEYEGRFLAYGADDKKVQKFFEEHRGLYTSGFLRWWEPQRRSISPEFAAYVEQRIMDEVGGLESPSSAD